MVSLPGDHPGGDETPDGDLILAGALTVVPDKDGVLPPWPEKVVEGSPTRVHQSMILTWSRR